LQSTNPLIQFTVGLLTGFSRPEYEGTDTGIHGDLGSLIDIPSTAGMAQAYVLSAPAPPLTFIDLILTALFESTANLQFASCAAPVDESGGPTAVSMQSCTQNRV
jgi:hypothetical protein